MYIFLYMFYFIIKMKEGDNMRYNEYELFDEIIEKLLSIYENMKDYERDKDLVANFIKLLDVAKTLGIATIANASISLWKKIEVDNLIKEIENKYHITFERKEDENFYYFICNINGFIHNFYLSKANEVLYARYTLENVTCNGLVLYESDILFEIRRWLTKLGVIKESSILKMEDFE